MTTIRLGPRSTRPASSRASSAPLHPPPTTPMVCVDRATSGPPAAPLGSPNPPAGCGAGASIILAYQI